MTHDEEKQLRDPLNGPYHLELWGAGAIHQGIKGDFWFPSSDERLFFLLSARSVEELPIAAVTHDGDASFVRTMCYLVFVFEGKEYRVEYDFGIGGKFEDAHFLFTEGNFACDCNRSSIIRRKYPEFPEMDCGEKIRLMQFAPRRRFILENVE